MRDLFKCAQNHPSAVQSAGCWRRPPANITKYDGGGIGKGATGTLFLDAEQIAEGRIDQTTAIRFSLDESSMSAKTRELPSSRDTRTKCRSRSPGRSRGSSCCFNQKSSRRTTSSGCGSKKQGRGWPFSNTTWRGAPRGVLHRAVLLVHKLRILHQKDRSDLKRLSCCINLVHNWTMIYGYARVSTDGQSVDAQVKQLRLAGAEKVFRETASGAQTDRAGLRQVLGRLGKGDVLMVTRLDRLARSTRDLLNTLAAVAVREAGFRSLGDTWADTTAHGRSA